MIVRAGHSRNVFFFIFDDQILKRLEHRQLTVRRAAKLIAVEKFGAVELHEFVHLFLARYLQPPIRTDEIPIAPADLSRIDERRDFAVRIRHDPVAERFQFRHRFGDFPFVFVEHGLIVDESRHRGGAWENVIVQIVLVVCLAVRLPGTRYLFENRLFLARDLRVIQLVEIFKLIQRRIALPRRSQ